MSKIFLSIVNAYGLNGKSLQAIELYEQIPARFINEVTYICILNACSHSGLVDKAVSIFDKIEMKTVRIYTVMVKQNIHSFEGFPSFSL